MVIKPVQQPRVLFTNSIGVLPYTFTATSHFWIICCLQVPAWVPLGLHSGNSIVAILDLLICIRHRTFSKRAEIGQTVITVGYVVWLMTCRFHIGRFPYPFM